MRDIVDGINERAWERAMAKPLELLSCGHPESEHSSITRGWATKSDGTKVCYACAEAEEKATLLTSTHHMAYLSQVRGDPHNHKLTGWPGWELATVTALWETSCGGFMRNHNILRFQATDVHGQKWYGTSPGVGMYARMHKAKA